MHAIGSLQHNAAFYCVTRCKLAYVLALKVWVKPNFLFLASMEFIMGQMWTTTWIYSPLLQEHANISCQLHRVGIKTSFDYLKFIMLGCMNCCLMKILSMQEGYQSVMSNVSSVHYHLHQKHTKVKQKMSILENYNCINLLSFLYKSDIKR